MITKTALLVIDMQNDFTRPGARAYYPTTEKLMEKYPDRINQLREKGVQIVIIYSLVPADDVQTELTRVTLSTRTLVEGTYGAEYDDRIYYEEGVDWKIRKYAASSFWGNDLYERLKKNGIENVLVSGVKTNVCCRHTTVDSSSYGFRTIMISDMVATNTEELNQFHLNELGHQYCSVFTFDEVMKMLDSGLL